MAIRHLFSIDDLGQNDIESIIDDAAAFQKSGAAGMELAGKLAGLCFFQQSTRTRTGFDAAMKRLGGATLYVTEPREVPRAPFGESLEDTIRVVSAYCDVIIMRHAESEAVEKAMQVSIAPVINGGSGPDHHPTQALLDLFHIRMHFGKLAGLRIGIVGDLPTSRAAKSLVRALRHWPPAELRLMSPLGRMLSKADLNKIDPSTISAYDRLVPDDLDILYVAGLPNPEGGPRFSTGIRESFRVNMDIINVMLEYSIMMCPLPRIDEIDPAVDESPKATFFGQSDNGMWIRMAILRWILRDK